MRKLEPLVYDRVVEDVSRVEAFISATYAGLSSVDKIEWDSIRSKGAWNYTDVNRINTWIEYLYAKLQEVGYLVLDIDVAQLEYSEHSEFFFEDLEVLRNNVQSFYNKWVKPDEWSSITHEDYLTELSANILEKNLNLLNELYEAMLNGYVYSNELYSGEVFI